jgi:cation diffusion facilitator CzcD-associated flavoprotein CzcO
VPENIKQFDAVVVGAGFAGLYMLYRLRGLGLSVRVLEAGDGVGGTWYWNRYPGARCDVESMDYSYSFSDELQQEWQWTERYASQPEILKYINHVADRFDLRRDIQLSTRVSRTVYEERAARWTISTEHGDELQARFCIMATGCLSTPQFPPPFAGLETFEGRWYHTGRWPHDGVDFTGQRVAVIGTGSSAIQSIPIVAQQAAQLYVFQRTANYSIPAHNGPLGQDYEKRVKAEYPAFRHRARESRIGFVVPVNDQPAMALSRDEREREYEARWARGGLGFGFSFNDLLVDENANDTAAEYFRNKIRSIVRDPQVAEMLCPRDYPMGTKRMCVDTNYYTTFNRDNVTLIDLRRTPIETLTQHGVRTTEQEYEVDAIVFAIGFDAMTGSLTRIDIRGRGGQLLRDKWEAGPRTYLGLAVAGFPNLFMITGPGSPSVLSNMIVSIEQHVEWIAGCIAELRRRGDTTIEATQKAEDEWVEHVSEIGHMTLYPRANSWYVGANIPGKARVFMPYIGGVGVYRQKCDEVSANGYEGFATTAAAAAD